MIKFVRTLIAAALIAVPMSASAVTVSGTSTVAPGDVFDVSGGPQFLEVTFDAPTAGDSFALTVTNNTSSVASVASVIADVFEFGLSFAGGVDISWANGGSGTISVGQQLTVKTEIDVGAQDVLTVTFGDVVDNNMGFLNSGIQLSIAATPVPLPAGGLLLIGGLGALALARRRKAAELA